AQFSEYAKRFGSLLLAGLFLLTSVGFTAIVIWQSARDNKDQAAQVSPEQETTNQETGENMLQGTQLADFTPSTERVSELQITDPVPGTGQEAKKGDTITAHYTGALVPTGAIFQSSLDTGQPFTAKVLTSEESSDGNGLIAGWVEGIPGMKVGGKRRLVIPAAKAYGPAGRSPSIPADTDLVFDIELVSIQ
ncbi:MAG: FKBP-type peptidyl-prolyl cis-trans isomerase, partial [Candidatus Saccharimonadales bacterium]